MKGEKQHKHSTNTHKGRPEWARQLLMLMVPLFFWLVVNSHLIAFGLVLASASLRCW